MDPRYRAWKDQQPKGNGDETAKQAEAQRLAQLMQEGQESEFWPLLTMKINGLIVQAEARFLDGLAPDYQTYVQWWARRQALIQVLALPSRLVEEVKGSQER